MSRQDSDNQQAILQSLDEIKAQNGEIVAKIDNLEQNITKKATVAGAVAGAVTGSITGGIINVGMEFIRIKLGG
ncbi:hypothetical protein LP109_13530 [Moraxella bovis]|uniref:Uncharacterized protein n=2 Tax=Moraxella TaxID=475 RepID=A0A378QRW9_9GAMM|nr:MULTISPECIES: hypothetical protein [Moraxella]MDI4482788.1 hypothetical protein [Moraxella lacunata]MDI4507255.1 hypothetical protein [Moraxella lacunata]OBX61396.1 hypothetical protein A9Z63_08140 [Moraxella lacunata]OBX67254.1 hypothetical protein A9309_01200 [Moraxella lacunata]OPH33249.1 hypothetical protein B5J93_13060 [Moraxella equi]